MTRDKKNQYRAAIALRLTLDEIHNPGANLHNGVDIIAMCEGVFGDLTAGLDFNVIKVIREEMTPAARGLDRCN